MPSTKSLLQYFLRKLETSSEAKDTHNLILFDIYFQIAAFG